MSTVQIRAGSRVYIEWKIRDATQYPPPLIDPANIPTISVYNPSNAAMVTDQPMTKVDIGVYGYTYYSQGTDPLGVYTMDMKATDNVGIITKSLITTAFQLV